MFWIFGYSFGSQFGSGLVSVFFGSMDIEGI